MTVPPLHLAAESTALETMPSIVGEDFCSLLDARASRLNRSSGNVLVSGETGTGKGLVARYLFSRSTAYRKLFRVLSLNQIPDSLFESELFGHRKGAFTGADRDFEGKIKSADGGTVLLDDIDALPLHLQTKLLRVIEDKEFERIGDSKPTHVDIRIISTTNASLPELVQAGRFRRDFFYRLAVIEIQVPALRERPKDLEALANHYLHQIGANQGKVLSTFAVDARRLLRGYPWPGNVRELISEVERVVSLADPTQEVVVAADLSEKIRANDPDLPLERADLSAAVRKLTREQILQALVRSHGHRGRAAADLGISRRTLYNKMADLGIRLQ